MRSKSKRGGLVYSTEAGHACAVCGWPKERCACSKPASTNTPLAAPASGVRVGRETKGRSGKGVTVVTGLPLAAAELERLASELKRRCGSGGTVKAGVIEIQGDHRDLLVEELGKRGYSVRRSGG